MHIIDKIYGPFDITSPVIIELINSPTVQRLKHISQYGVPDEFYYIHSYSRYEHSIGVMLLLKKLGATEEEQIAGLLHDVAHTTFSHVIDWLYNKTGTEDSQDNEQASFVMKSEIPDILKKYNFDPAHISHHTSYSLLDRDMPELCADRIDYSLRQFPLHLAKRFVADLSVYDNTIVFSDPDTAITFAYYFLDRQIHHWGGFQSTSRYYIFAGILRRALELKLITPADFWKTDDYITSILKKSSDPVIQSHLSILRSKSLKKLKRSKELIPKKFRYVNPQVKKDNKLIRVSSLYPVFAQMVSVAKQKNQKGVRVACP